MEESNIDPFVNTFGYLFVMDYIVPGWTITFLVKLKFITSQTWKDLSELEPFLKVWKT